jgi:ABC-type uncharacterized transport system YnjBCD ATPase subunit
VTPNDARRETERRQGQYDQLLKQKAGIEERILCLKQQYEDTRTAQALIQTVAQATQKQLEYHISELVSLALAAVFPHPYSLRLDFELRRGRSEAVLSFSRGDGERIDPLSASGGGPVDVACWALRVSLWSLRNPKSRRTILLDEPFRFVSRDLQPRASAMLKEISAKMKLQFIIVTHEENLVECADRVFEVTMNGKKGESRVTVSGGKDAD